MSSAMFTGLYTKGTRVWISDAENVWKCARIKTDFVDGSKELMVEDEDAMSVPVAIQSASKLPALRNPDILIGANDLTSLSYLHEPAVLYNLRVRFLDHSVIYTWCGIVLVAINPYIDLNIYGEDTIQIYHQSGNEQLDPHIYAVAEEAFSKLERESRNQSIIVSGESGAGKTVSAKFVMRYFASIAGSRSTNIEHRVLASNPIMEAIGNAKTTRNDNSSRFGKYIQIMFDPYSRSITGGHMRTYLLEKSRISRQADGERNFHVFYQMCTYARQYELTDLQLSDEYEFAYLGQFEPSSKDDLSKFLEALDVLGFSDKQRIIIFKVVAAILHAGNITFFETDEEACAVADDDPHLDAFCELLGLEKPATQKWLTNRVIRTGSKEVIVTPVAKDLAQYARDALAKFIYEKMFLWVVTLINKALGPSDAKSSATFIGVLDIYGFEHFEVNSFEQFCINFANEVLQQQFNQHVFKLEQDEYIREGIDWQMITFSDNQPVIDLITTKPIGVLNLLDEECKMPKGTDETWCAKLYNQLPVGSIFQKPKFGWQKSFIIQHFADKVTYQVEGFLEKNRDTVWDEQIDLVKRSQFLDAIFAEDGDRPEHKSGKKVKISAQQQMKQQRQAKATVGSQFRDSLNDLMKTLNATTPHYVRCIKPNDDKAGFEFENTRAVQQLRACGVLETIRISSNGFPSRWTYQEFANRYRVLLVAMDKHISRPKPSTEASSEPHKKLVRAGSTTASEVRQICEDIISLIYVKQVYSKFRLPFEEQRAKQEQQQLYQLGKTKIFFRAGQVALLERIRAQRLRDCAVLLQRMMRGFIVRRRYVKIKSAVLSIQCFARGLLARKRYLHMRRTRAATRVQKTWKGYRQRQQYHLLQRTAVILQAWGRGRLARDRYNAMRRERAAITIQKHLRSYLARKAYRKEYCQVIIVQNSIRRFLARRTLKKLKIEAKSVEHVKSLNKGLENKIIELQQKLDVMKQNAAKNDQIQAATGAIKAETEKSEAENKHLKTLLKSKEAELASLRVELVELQRHASNLESIQEEQGKMIDKLKTEREEVQQQLDSKATAEAIAEREAVLLARFEREKKALIEEKQTEKANYQNLLRRYMELEEEKQRPSSGEITEDEVTAVGGSRSPDISTVSLMMRCSELEQERAKLKHENEEMRNAMATGDDSTGDGGGGASLLAQKCSMLQAELDRANEERSNLKTIVLSQESSMKDHSAEGEVLGAYKSIIKQLEREVEEEKEKNQEKQIEMKSLKRDNDRQQQIIGMKSKDISSAANDDFVMKLNQEKMLLQEKCNKLAHENNDYKIKLMRINALESTDYMENGDDGQPNNKHAMGMFQYVQQNEGLILKTLITDLQPDLALKIPPHFPAYILFMCTRYTDYCNDDVQVRSLMNNAIVAIKRIIKRRQNIETYVLWLANTMKLLNCLMQYSGEEAYGEFPESLKNFDLSEYRTILSEVAIWISQGVIKLSEERIQPLIVPAILEYEGLASSGIYSKPPNQRSGSVDKDSLPSSPTDKPMDNLISELSYLHKTLLLHVVESDLINQIFKQLFYFTCAGALNNLLLRKDLCHWNKAMQIRFNLSVLEQWCREQQIPKWNEVVETLEPIIQATKLLQTKKSIENIPTIVEMCNKLGSSQIVKVLNLYTAGEEETVSTKFIKKVQQHLAEHRREPSSGNQPLLMDTKYAFAVSLPYTPSDVRLQDIIIPPALLKKGIGTVLKKI